MLSRLMTRREQLLLLFIALSLTVGAVALLVHDRPGKTDAQAKENDPAVVRAAKDKVPDTENAKSPSPQEKLNAATPITEVASSATIDVPPSPVAPFEITVSVAGAVNTPGVYRLASHSRLQDALNAAGGPTEEAITSDLNLAALLIDGATLTVPLCAKAEKDGTTLRMRPAQDAAQLNPAQYTISGSRVVTAKPTVNSPAAAPLQGNVATATSGSQPSSLIDLNTADAAALDTLPGVGPKTAQDIITYRTQSPFTSVDDLDNVPGIGPKKMETIRPFVTVGPAK